jgi:hypothetical protein
MSGEYEVRVDPIKNRLYIRIIGFFRGKDVEPALAALEVALRDVKPGFDTVTDLSEFLPGAPGAASALARGAEMVKAKGRRRGVRITVGLMTGIMQFQRFLKGVFDDKTTRSAKSIQEADEILDSWTDES